MGTALSPCVPCDGRSRRPTSRTSDFNLLLHSLRLLALAIWAADPEAGKRTVAQASFPIRGMLVQLPSCASRVNHGFHFRAHVFTASNPPEIDLNNAS
jgi:hypothetical protein